MVCSCQLLDIQEALIDILFFLFYLVNVESSTGDQILSQIIQGLKFILERYSILSVSYTISNTQTQDFNHYWFMFKTQAR